MRVVEVLKIALLLGTALLWLAGCGRERTVNIEEVTSRPKQFVGSETCKSCHLEHFDAWRMTLHSRMLQDVRINRDAIIVELDPERIKSDLRQIEGKLKIPVEEFYIPKPEEVLYTIGSQWKQRYIVEHNGMLVIAPVQYNVDSGRWVNYNEANWNERSWILLCGGCHATGVTLEGVEGKQGSFMEPGIGCEACHGQGSWHAALPRQALFEKRETIINPAKLSSGTAAQICGSCHNRGKATKFKGASWPVGYEPGKALEIYFQSTSFAAGDAQHMYGNEFSSAHHQQYIDWRQSKHFMEGVSCTSCHYVHRLGVPPTRLQTREAGSAQCLSCHQMVNGNKAHAIHSFGNCVGCHMPRVVKSAESGDLHSHVFQALLPRVTLTNAEFPNSCVTCHRHKDADLNILQQQYDVLSRLPRPQGAQAQIPEMPEKEVELLRATPPEAPPGRLPEKTTGAK
jgi:hypothetical protein